VLVGGDIEAHLHGQMDLEQVLGVKRGVVGGPPRGEQDEPMVPASEFSSEPAGLCRLTAQQPAQYVGLCVDLGGHDRAGRATGSVSGGHWIGVVRGADPSVATNL